MEPVSELEPLTTALLEQVQELRRLFERGALVPEDAAGVLSATEGVVVELRAAALRHRASSNRAWRRFLIEHPELDHG